MTTYGTRATAVRGAVRKLKVSKDVALKAITLSEDGDGRWSWAVKAVLPSAAELVETEEFAPPVVSKPNPSLFAAEEAEPSVVKTIVVAPADLPPGEYEAEIVKIEVAPISEQTITIEAKHINARRMHFEHSSTCENPTRLVWVIADEMKGARRKDVIAACVDKGVAYNTARTQYQLWFTATKNSSPAIE